MRPWSGRHRWIPKLHFYRHNLLLTKQSLLTKNRQREEDGSYREEWRANFSSQPDQSILRVFPECHYHILSRGFWVIWVFCLWKDATFSWNVFLRCQCQYIQEFWVWCCQELHRFPLHWSWQLMNLAIPSVFLGRYRTRGLRIPWLRFFLWDHTQYLCRKILNRLLVFLQNSKLEIFPSVHKFYTRIVWVLVVFYSILVFLWLLLKFQKLLRILMFQFFLLLWILVSWFFLHPYRGVK